MKGSNSFSEYMAQLEAVASMAPLLKMLEQRDLGVEGLRAVASGLSLLRNPRSEVLKTPDLTLKDGGGDWDDVICLLMSAARQAGMTTRIVVRGGKTAHLQVRIDDASKWEDIGPAGFIPGVVR